MTAASYRFVVRGRVQGVGFREATRRQAKRLGLDGWVMNRVDGAVEGLTRGAAPALERLRAWLAEGPPLAQVTACEWHEDDEVPSPGFVVRR